MNLASLTDTEWNARVKIQFSGSRGILGHVTEFSESDRTRGR
jgi:hypothetical protein